MAFLWFQGELMSLWVFCSVGSCAVRAPGVDTLTSVPQNSPFSLYSQYGRWLEMLEMTTFEDLYFSDMNLFLTVYSFVCV